MTNERQDAVVTLQHAIDHMQDNPDAVFILANAIPDVVIEAAEEGIFLDPLSIGKTLEQWRASKLDLSKFLAVGDRVDNSIYEYMRDVLPPITHRWNLLQMGEPYSNVNGRATYSTLRRGENGGWIYAGHCHAGNAQEPVPFPTDSEDWLDNFNYVGSSHHY